LDFRESISERFPAASHPAETGTQRPSVICLRAPNWPARLANPGGRKVFFGESAKETRMRLGIYLAVIGLVVPAMALAQQFHASMVEVGSVSPQEPHVTFDPPFPSTPKVVLSIRDQNVGGTYRGCGVEAKNITATGFDYFPACSARRPGGPLPVPLNLIATWIATLQQ
jgi:hypothetical protein